LMLVGPRVVLFFGWLMSDWYDAFDSSLVALLGWVLMPWTSLAWMYTHFNNAGELGGGYLLLLILGVFFDLGSVGGGRMAQRQEQD
ncbi:MAG: hypothetical protein OXU20_21090, partial [Myxococcales bacterium]|nr:hypothetical protein [Myxococcales bacterium]